MQMNDVNEEVEPVVDDAIASEQKMLKLIEQMQNSANEVPTVQDTNADANIGLNVKTDDDINYWDIDDIPTGYKLYPEGTKIVARPLKVLEVKKLTGLNDYNADTVVNDILRKSVRGIDVNEIYSADKMYMLLWLRANSFRDNRYVVGYMCDECQEESSYHFDINNVDVDYLSDEYDPNKIIKLSNGDEITIKLLQIKDEVGISSFNKKYTDIFKKSGDGIDDELLAISFMINTINGVAIDAVKRYNYLLEMCAEDFSQLTSALAKTSVGVRPYITSTCDKCGGESQIGITFHPDFFLPRLKTE